MRKTKIICTLGPSTDKGDVLRDLIANGMNVARFNFSHGSYEEHGGRLAKLKALREELGKPVAALLDTKGPEIRLQAAVYDQWEQKLSVQRVGLYGRAEKTKTLPTIIIIIPAQESKRNFCLNTSFWQGICPKRGLQKL